MNYGVIKIEGQNYVPLEHAAFKTHLPVPYLARLTRSGELLFREIKGNIYIREISLNSFIAKREHMLIRHVVSVPSTETGNITQNIDIPQSTDIESTSLNAKSLSVVEAAAVAGLSENYIGKLIRSGTIGAVQESGETRITESALDAFIENHARRLTARKERLAEDRAREYAHLLPKSDTGRSVSPARIVPVEPVPSRYTEFVRQIAVFAVALVIGSGIFMLARSDKHMALMSHTARSMTASAAQSAGVLADVARSVNAKVNSLLGISSYQYVRAEPSVVQTFAAATSTVNATYTPPAQIINQTIVQQPVIEHTIETRTVVNGPASSGISQADLDTRLQELENKLSARMYSLSSANSTAIAQNYVVTSQTSAINQLNNTKITDPTITGGSINGTSITTDSLQVGGTAAFSDASIAGDLTLSGALHFSGSSSTLSAQGATFVNASSTSLFASVAHFASAIIDSLSAAVANITDLTATNATTTNLAVIGNTNLATSTITGALNTSGDVTVGGNLTVDGNSVTLGTSTSNLLYINSMIASNLIPNGNKILDLGSPSFFWRNAYIDTLNVNSISAASSSIGGTNSETFTINADNGTTDSQDMNLIFYRGTIVPNAVISWNSLVSAKRFEFNQPVFISSQSGSTTQTTLTLKGISGQTGNIFAVASSSGANLFAVGSQGTLFAATTSVSNLSVTGSGLSSFAGGLTVGGDLTVNGAFSPTGLFSTVNASSSLFSVFNKAYFGASATSSFDSTGALTLSSALAAGSGGTGISNPSAAGVLLGNYSGTGYQQLATSSLGLLTTNVTEGANQYFTVGRAQSAISISGAPLTYSGGVLGINQANGSQDGYLSSPDWITFNNKLASSSISNSAMLASLLSDETGTGSVVFSASPTFTGTSAFANTIFSGTTLHTGLATFGNASTSIFSAFGPAYFGSTATSTFSSSGALALAGGLTGTSGSFSGNVGVGTTTPFRAFAVQNTSSAAQVAIAYDATRVTELKTDSGGDFHLNPTGQDSQLDDSNLWVCAGGSCPAGAPSGTGNLIVENYVGIGTSTPTQQLSVQGLLQVGANSNSIITMGTATSTFNGDVKVLGKLDVSTIDPVYMIDNTKYATYGASTVGIHEEVVTQLRPRDWNAAKKMYEYTIDFKTLEQGSDLWLFYQVTDFGPTWQNLVVTLTPGFDGRTYYEQDISHSQLHIYASQQGPVSVRLIANRYDFSKWNNLRPDQDGDTAGAHVISSK